MATAAFNTLLDHRRQFLGFVQCRVPDPAIAEDILQAAYLRALEREGELGSRESIVGWFYRVLRNAVIDQYRRRASEDHALEHWAKEMEGQTAPPPETKREVCACLSRVLDTLPPSYADLLRSVDLGEQPLQQFAARQNISPANAAVRAHRARAALRKHLIETCGDCAEQACADCTCRS